MLDLSKYKKVRQNARFWLARKRNQPVKVRLMRIDDRKSYFIQTKDILKNWPTVEHWKTLKIVEVPISLYSRISPWCIPAVEWTCKCNSNLKFKLRLSKKLTVKNNWTLYLWTPLKSKFLNPLTETDTHIMNVSDAFKAGVLE